MKKQQKKRFFNLIEVTVAIAVVGIGIAGIMALLPPAIEANRSADYNNYTGDVVSTLATYIETKLRRDWATEIGKIPDSKPTTTSLQFSPTDDDTSKSVDNRRWKPITGLNGLFRIHASASGTHTAGVYGVRSSDEGVRANILVWQETPVPNLKIYKPIMDASGNPTSESVSITNSAKVTFELSYPAGVPYEQRTRKQFVYEFYQRQP